MYNLEIPYVADGSNMRIAASVKPTAALSGDTLKLWVRYEDSLGHSNYLNYYTSSTLAANSWTRVSGDLPVPSGMTVKQIGIGVYKACTFDVMDFELWDGTDATKAVASHTPYATDGHLQAVYATQASLKVANDGIESEVKARAELSDAVSDLSTTVSQTADSITASVTSLRAEMSSKASNAASKLDSLGEGVGDARKAVDALERTVSSSLRFGADGVELGRSDSNTRLKMGADRMSFVNNGNEVMYITGDRLFINSAQVVQSQQVGQYMWFTRGNGNMGLKWVNG